MKKLSRAQFEKSEQYILDHARPVDQALFRFLFQSGDQNSVINEVGKYQNPDGGFGQSIEPDFRLPDSSSLATTVAFQYLLAVDASKEAPVVQKGIQYLLNTVDEKTLSWEVVPPNINKYPGAPWWKYEIWSSRGIAEWANPNAEITAIFNKYSALIPTPLLEKLNHQAVLALNEWPTKAEMHDFLCFEKLSRNASPELSQKILEALQNRIKNTVELNPENWPKYGLRPIWVIDYPHSALKESISHALNLNLEFEISHQLEDGSWAPFWDWGENTTESQQSHKEWKGHLSVKVLRTLKAFDLIEEP